MAHKWFCNGEFKSDWQKRPQFLLPNLMVSKQRKQIFWKRWMFSGMGIFCEVDWAAE